MMRQNLVINSDGKYRIKPELFGKAAGTLIFYISGSAGGGTIQLEYEDTFKNMVPLVDGLLDVDNQYQVHAGIVSNLYVVVAGSSGASLNVIVTGKV